MAKVLHAADFHLDSAFRSLPEEQARLRRQESRELPGRLVDWANDHGARLMLLSGDLFDSDRLFSQTAQMLAQALARFRGTVVIAPGNHDWLSAASPYRSWAAPYTARPSPPRRRRKAACGAFMPSLTATPASWSSTGMLAAGRAATAPSPRRRSPPRAWTIWPWAMSTPLRP